MLLKKSKDWKTFLSVDDEEKMNDLLRKISKHRGAYKNAEDIKLAQLWCTILELRKENLLLQKRLQKIEDIFEVVFEKTRKQDDECRMLLKSLEQL